MEAIIKFDTLLLKAFDKMVREVKIELTVKGKEGIKKYCNDRWWYIQSISILYVLLLTLLLLLV